MEADCGRYFRASRPYGIRKRRRRLLWGRPGVAGVTAGAWQTLADTVKVITPQSETLPQEENRQVYQKYYQDYIRFYDALKWSYHKI